MSDDGNAARVVDARKIYGEGEAEVRALDGITEEFPSGQFTAIMGPSGSGKSTLLQTMAGLDQLTSGRAWLGDTEITDLSEKKLTRVRRDKVGFIFQAYNLVPTLTVRENITLPMDIARTKPDEEWIATVVAALDIEDRLGHRPSELSGGQQQRAAIARALGSRPDIIFADEPTGALDSHTGAEMLGFMKRAVDEFSQTVVMVTHDPNAASFANRVLFLRDGKVADRMNDPTADAVLDHMKTLGD
ncbi:MAG: ABC transporter ATP-binding protein [Thermoleophilia bacterium]|nr:ABC transporter ATP-binding protein [Thermoleophilia bacterium]